MASNLQSLLVAIVFASQIIVLSFYVPLRWRRYYALMFERYPPQQYPRLYPVPQAEIERNQAVFGSVQLAVGVAAVISCIGALIYATSPRLIATLMMVCGLVQTMLMMSVAMRLEARIGMAFRGVPPPSVRSAELRRWRVTDFVSPLWIGLGLGLQVMGLACAAFVWLHWPQTLALRPATIAGAGLLAVMTYALVRPDRLTRVDPYMSPADTFAARQARYRGVFRAGAVLGVYQTFILLYNTRFIRFDGVYLFMIFSVLLQLWGLLIVMRLTRNFSKRDFSVYRAEGGAQVAP